MEITNIPVEGYEKVVEARDDSINFHAIIAIHDTTLGPALGGCRMWNYDSRDEALKDVLRLSEGMTYKAACAGLDLGGGKSVIIGDKENKTEDIFLAMGKFVDSLEGKYITAEDVGTSVADMATIRKNTKNVTGLSREDGSSGDPSPFTAYGVFVGMKACVEEVFGSDDFSNLTVAVQGVGHVGYYLAKHVKEAGGSLIISDIDEAQVNKVAEELGAKVVGVDEIYSVDADIYAPAALGATINDDTIPQLKCKIVAGPANNQLDEDRHADVLTEKGILYAPDYVLNAGGLINVYAELLPGGYNEKKAMDKVSTIYDAIKNIIDHAKKENISTAAAAQQLALNRLKVARDGAQ